MALRVTIMLNENINRRIRMVQAKIIKDSGKTYSFSSAINDLLEKSLK